MAAIRDANPDLFPKGKSTKESAQELSGWIQNTVEGRAGKSDIPASETVQLWHAVDISPFLAAGDPSTAQGLFATVFPLIFSSDLSVRTRVVEVMPIFFRADPDLVHPSALYRIYALGHEGVFFLGNAVDSVLSTVGLEHLLQAGIPCCQRGPIVGRGFIAAPLDPDLYVLNGHKGDFMMGPKGEWVEITQNRVLFEDPPVILLRGSEWEKDLRPLAQEPPSFDAISKYFSGLKDISSRFRTTSPLRG